MIQDWSMVRTFPQDRCNSKVQSGEDGKYEVLSQSVAYSSQLPACCYNVK